MTAKELLFVSAGSSCGSWRHAFRTIRFGGLYPLSQALKGRGKLLDRQARPQGAAGVSLKAQRVKACIAIACMAFVTWSTGSCFNSRRSRRGGSMRPAVRKCSTKGETRSGRCFAQPSKTPPDMNRICLILGFPLSEAPNRID